MTTSAPNLDDPYLPGVCECCGAEAPVIPLLWNRSSPPIGRCTVCHNAPEEEMPDLYSDGSDGPSAWWPGVEADHPDWY